jgi:hypothetical protein
MRRVSRSFTSGPTVRLRRDLCTRPEHPSAHDDANIPLSPASLLADGLGGGQPQPVDLAVHVDGVKTDLS